MAMILYSELQNKFNYLNGVCEMGNDNFFGKVTASVIDSEGRRREWTSDTATVKGIMHLLINSKRNTPLLIRNKNIMLHQLSRSNLSHYLLFVKDSRRKWRQVVGGKLKPPKSMRHRLQF
jgi:hypothetical protein